MLSCTRLPVLPILLAMLLSACSGEEMEYYGIIKSMPEDGVGTWRIGSRDFEVDRWVDIEEDEGEIMVGRCVEVDLEGDEVEEIETKAMHRCLYPDNR